MNEDWVGKNQEQKSTKEIIHGSKDNRNDYEKKARCCTHFGKSLQYHSSLGRWKRSPQIYNGTILVLDRREGVALIY